MSEFNQIVKKHFSKLKFFTLAITRAHGENHPEVFEVRKLFKSINKKVKKSKPDKPNLDEEFVQLRKVTNNYLIPGDACDVYKSTYKMLEDVDKAYQA